MRLVATLGPYSRTRNYQEDACDKQNKVPFLPEKPGHFESGTTSVQNQCLCRGSKYLPLMLKKNKRWHGIFVPFRSFNNFNIRLVNEAWHISKCPGSTTVMASTRLRFVGDWRAAASLPQPWQALQFLGDWISHEVFIWLVVYLPLWKVWKSIGMIIPNIWKKCSKPPTSHDWHFQPKYGSHQLEDGIQSAGPNHPTSSNSNSNGNDHQLPPGSMGQIQSYPVNDTAENQSENPKLHQITISYPVNICQYNINYHEFLKRQQIPKADHDISRLTWTCCVIGPKPTTWVWTPFPWPGTRCTCAATRLHLFWTKPLMPLRHYDSVKLWIEIVVQGLSRINAIKGGNFAEMCRCAGLLAWWMLKAGTSIYTFHNIALTKASSVSSKV